MDAPSVDDIKRRLPGLLARGGRDLRVAAAFLTRLPLPVAGTHFAGDDGEATLAQAAGAFPIIGAGIGLAAGAGFAAAYALGLTPLVSALIALALATVLTGGLHEDGLADTADGLGGGAGRDDKLRIMRDSRTGAYGVLALVFSVGVRAALLAAAPGAAFGALIAAGAVSRAVLPAVMAGIEPARADGLGAGAGRPGRTEVALALALAAAIALVAAGPAAGLTACLLAAAAAAAVAALAQAQVGGFTGDVLGAVQQGAEVAVLLAVVLVAAW